MENIEAQAAEESSSESSATSTGSSCVSVVCDGPGYMGMLDSGMLPALFASDDDDGDGGDHAVVVRTIKSFESERKQGSSRVSYSEWHSDHLTPLNSHSRSQ